MTKLSRTRWLGLAVVGASLLGLLPSTPARAAQAIEFKGGETELTCGYASGTIGPSEFTVPHPARNQPPRPLVFCNSSRTSSVAAGSMTGTLSAVAKGSSTEGTLSHASSFFYANHTLWSSVDRLTVKFSFMVEQAKVEVPPMAKPTTTALVMFIGSINHPGCPKCTGSGYVLLADSSPVISGPEVVERKAFTLEVVFTNPNGKVPAGYVNIVPIAGAFVSTGSYTSPFEPQGSASYKIKLTGATLG